MIDIKSKKIEELVEFPCEYAVKIIGVNHAEFSVKVLEKFTEHSIAIINDKIAFNASQGDKYLSMTVFFRAESADQIRQIYSVISELDFVRMCL